MKRTLYPFLLAAILSACTTTQAEKKPAEKIDTTTKGASPAKVEKAQIYNVRVTRTDTLSIVRFDDFTISFHRFETIPLERTAPSGADTVHIVYENLEDGAEYCQYLIETEQLENVMMSYCHSLTWMLPTEDMNQQLDFPGTHTTWTVMPMVSGKFVWPDYDEKRDFFPDVNYLDLADSVKSQFGDKFREEFELPKSSADIDRFAHYDTLILEISGRRKSDGVIVKKYLQFDVIYGC